MKKVTIFTTGFTLTAIAASDSWALGLGDLTLNSHLNEPISAQIELLDAGAIDESDVRISLAHDAEFDRFGIVRSVYLTQIRFEIETTERGKFVALSAAEPLREPYLELVVEARWPTGRLLKDYTVLIDLPPEPLSQSDVREVPLSDLSPANDAAAHSTVPAESKYVSGTSKQPKRGSAYLVKTTDTLWSIATAAAPDGATIEQTMLAIVAENPTAFHAQNVNGLKSGYVLQLPDNTDDMLDSGKALAEVALQNREWQEGLATSDSGLRLVTDADLAEELPLTEPLEEINPLNGVSPTQRSDVDQATLESSDPNQARIATLVSTISELEANIEGLRADLAERDAEVVKLRAALAERQAAMTANTQTVQSERYPGSRVVEMIEPFWPWFLGVGASLFGLFTIRWLQTGRSRQAHEAPFSSSEAPALATSASAAAESPPDLDARASNVLEEVEIYKTYGRADQAIELLVEAVNDGVAPPALVLRLVECYIESDRMPEAKALIDSLGLPEDDDLVGRANQMMLDAPNSASEKSDTGDQNASETKRIDEEGSVLGEFSFSTDPEFSSAPDGNALTLSPLDDDAPENGGETEESESIHGLETDPVDSQLDLARAYIDMGDEEGARPVLMSVIKEGDLSQQAQARELLLRIEVT